MTHLFTKIDQLVRKLQRNDLNADKEKRVGETSVATILQQLKDRFDEIEVEKKTRQKNYVRATSFID